MRMRCPRWMRPQLRRYGTANVGPAIQTQDLAGTAPFHNHYVMLHSLKHPQEFPKIVSSPVQKALQLALAPSNGLVNFSWSPPRSRPHMPTSSENEVYSAIAFSKEGDVVELEGLTISNVREAVQRITNPKSTVQSRGGAQPLYIYVCTHAARDCRCGDVGSSVAEALREEIDKRGLASTVRLGETGHVGGHKLNLLDPRSRMKRN